mgnify:CR=1 FL=1
MFTAFKNNRQSVFFSWLFSYVSVLMVPILISGVVYYEAANIIEVEINRANGALLKQVQQAIDNQMNDIQKVGLQIALNSNTTSLMYTKDHINDIHHYIAGKLIDDFRLYKLANGFIDNFYVYFKDINYVLSHETFAETSLYYNIYINKSNMEFSQWKDFLESMHNMEYVKMSRKNHDGSTIGTVAYVQSIPITDHNQSLGTLVIQLDEGRFLEATKNIKWGKSSEVFVIDKGNNIVSSSQSTGLSFNLDYNELLGNSGLIYKDMNGEKMAVSYIKSQLTNTNWMYVSVIPAKLFAEKADHIRKLIIGSIFLCLVVGGLVAYFFTRRNYNPIRELVNALANKAGIPLEKKYNEYRFIQEAISSTINEKEEIKEKLKRQDSVIRSNFMTRLLKGRLENSIPLDEALTSLDIKFISEHFAVILFYIEDYSELFNEHEKLDNEERLKLVQFIIANVVEELAGQKNKGFVTEVDNMMACLINFNEYELHDANNEMVRIVSEATKFIRERFKIHLTVSISSIHLTCAGIAKAYQEALDAMEYKVVVGSEEIIQYKNIMPVSSSACSYNYSLETEQQLINSVKVGDFQRSSTILNQIFQNNLCSGTLSIDIAKCLMFDLISTFLKTLDELGMNIKGSFIEDFNPVEQLLACKTIKDMKHKMTEILLMLCQQIQEKKKSHNLQLRDKVIEYICEKYSDENLSIAGIADNFNINLTYLSKFFKEQTGEGLLDYINRYRLEEAKRLLKESDENISDVAKKVGFYNSNALIRIFKKYEGITPGQYKELN